MKMLTWSKFHIGDKHPVMGSALHVLLPSTAAKGSDITVKIYYETTDGCTALQWLEKE